MPAELEIFDESGTIELVAMEWWVPELEPVN